MLLTVSKWWCICKGIASILSSIALLIICIVFGIYPGSYFPTYLFGLVIAVYVIGIIALIVSSIFSFYIAHQIDDFFAEGFSQLTCGILCLILVDVVPGILILIDYSRNDEYI